MGPLGYLRGLNFCYDFREYDRILNILNLSERRGPPKLSRFAYRQNFGSIAPSSSSLATSLLESLSSYIRSHFGDVYINKLEINEIYADTVNLRTNHPGDLVSFDIFGWGLVEGAYKII